MVNIHFLLAVFTPAISQVRQYGWFILPKRGYAVLATLLPCINLRWKVAAISSIHNICPCNFAHLQGQDFWFDQEVRIAFGQTVVWCFLSLSWMECTPALRLCVQCACLQVLLAKKLSGQYLTSPTKRRLAMAMYLVCLKFLPSFDSCVQNVTIQNQSHTAKTHPYIFCTFSECDLMDLQICAYFLYWVLCCFCYVSYYSYTSKWYVVCSWLMSA